MKKAKLLITTSLTAALLISASPVMGQGYAQRITTRLENEASRSAQRQSTELTNLQKRADTAIINRIDDLNRLITRIQNDTRLSSDEKTSLTASIQNSISGLNTLKAKIDADTDVTTARTDAKGIFTSFRVYEVVNPQTRLLIIIDNLQTATSTIQTLTPQLQNLINTLKSQGKDVSSLQASLDDINTQLQTITTKLSTDKTTVSGVTITTQDPQTTFTSVRQDLSGVRSDFAKIRSDFAQMSSSFAVVLKEGNSGNPSTPSASIKPSGQ